MTVDLFDGAGNYITSTTTDMNGNYYFSVAPHTAYQVSVNLDPGQNPPLTGLTVCDASLSGDDDLDSDPDNGDIFSIRPGYATIPLISPNTGVDFANDFGFFVPTLTGDPHIIGFNGQKFDFHGKANHVFNLVSDEYVQINSLFLEADLRPRKVFKTYVGALGFKAGSDRLLVECDRDNARHIALLNGKPITPKIVHELGYGSVYSTNDLKLKINIGDYFFKVKFSSSNHSSCHINFRSKFNGDAAVVSQNIESRPHGVLGQTIGKKVIKIDQKKVMQGEGIIDGVWTEYQIVGDDIFGDDFKYNRYNEVIAKNKKSENVYYKEASAVGFDDSDDEDFTGAAY